MNSRSLNHGKPLDLNNQKQHCMATYPVHIRFTGKIHDHDFGFWNPDEEEPYAFTLVRHLSTTGTPVNLEFSHTVDNEVKLILKLQLSMSAKKIVTSSGTLELWEGPYKWTKDVTVTIPKAEVKAGASKSIYNGKLENKGGDWATAAGVITVAPRPLDLTAKAHVIVIAETPGGRNVRFWDTKLNVELSRREFVQKIQAGLYPDYKVATLKGIDTPLSKPNKTKADNLG